MEIGKFWDIILIAQAHTEPGGSFDEALASYLATRTRQDILEYQERFDQLHAALYRWDVWAAAYLIGGGCSDDGFSYFRAGIIGQGEGWYQKVTASPDSLADHLAIADSPGCSQDEPLFYESLAYAAHEAFGGQEDLYDALDRFRHSGEQAAASGDPDDESPASEDPAGEEFDFEDDQQMRQRLPRLSAIFLT
jgi:hypothetical protein